MTPASVSWHRLGELYSLSAGLQWLFKRKTLTAPLDRPWPSDCILRKICSVTQTRKIRFGATAEEKDEETHFLSKPSHVWKVMIRPWDQAFSFSTLSQASLYCQCEFFSLSTESECVCTCFFFLWKIKLSEKLIASLTFCFCGLCRKLFIEQLSQVNDKMSQ